MPEEQTVEFDVDAIIGGNAESIVAKLSDLSDAELAALRKAEAVLLKPRKTVLDAIEAEQAGRAALAGEANQADPALLAAQAAAAAALAKRIEALEAMVAERDQRIADLEAAIASGSAKAGAKAPKPVALAELRELPDLTDAGELRVLCVGEDGKSLPAVPPLLFTADQFHAENGGLVLDAPIAFAREVPETAIHALFLAVDGKKGLTAGLVQPLVIGGGKSLELPKGHLLFAAAGN